MHTIVPESEDMICPQTGFILLRNICWPVGRNEHGAPACAGCCWPVAAWTAALGCCSASPAAANSDRPASCQVTRIGCGLLPFGRQHPATPQVLSLLGFRATTRTQNLVRSSLFYLFVLPACMLLYVWSEGEAQHSVVKGGDMSGRASSTGVGIAGQKHPDLGHPA